MRKVTSAALGPFRSQDKTLLTFRLYYSIISIIQCNTVLPSTGTNKPPNASRIIALVAKKSKLAERNYMLCITTSNALQMNNRYHQKPMLLVKHSRHLQETYHA